MYYAHTDHLGSLRLLTDANKGIASQYYYDAWGERTLVDGSHITNRGFTFHEHLDDFGLINMNARLYDPVLGRFLAPDPYVQDTEFSQSFNRYSYALNNPLNFTDPSGELIGELIYIGLMIYYAGVQQNAWYAAENGGNPFNPAHWNWNNPMTYVSMAAAGFGAYHQIGGLNGFSNTTAGTPAFSSGSDNFLNWLDAYEAKYNRGGLMSFLGPGGKSYVDPTPYYFKEVVINADRIHKAGNPVAAGNIFFDWLRRTDNWFFNSGRGSDKYGGYNFYGGLGLIPSQYIDPGAQMIDIEWYLNWRIPMKLPMPKSLNVAQGLNDLNKLPELLELNKVKPKSFVPQVETRTSFWINDSITRTWTFPNGSQGTYYPYDTIQKYIRTSTNGIDWSQKTFTYPSR